MPTPLASRFVHLDIRVDAEDWFAWGPAPTARNLFLHRVGTLRTGTSNS